MNDPSAIPPIDPSVAGAPAQEAPWVPPWLAQTPAPVDPQQPAPPAEIKMPDDFVGNAPAVAVAAPQQPPGPAPWSIVPDVHPDAIVNAPPPWLAAAQHAQSAPKLGAVDYALSQELGEPTSTGENPAASLHKIATDPNASPADRQLAWRQMTPEDRTNIVNNADPQQLAAIATAAMSPEELATVAVRHQQAQIHQQSADQLGIAIANDEAQRRNFAAMQAATTHANVETDAIARDAANLANTKPVLPGGAGFTVLSMLGGAIGGLAAKGAGLSSNPFIDGLNKGIETNLAVQRDEIANRWKGLDVRKNLVAEQFQRSGDMYRAQEVVRIAHYDSMIKQAQIAAQDYDPNGTTAVRIAQQTQAIQAARGAALQATNQTLVKNKLELMKAQNEALVQQETVRHNRQDERTQSWKTAIEADKNTIEKQKNQFALQDQQPIPMDLLAARHPGQPMPPANMFPQGMSEKQYAAWQESNNKGLESQGKEIENAQKLAAGQVRDINGNPAVDDKGKVIQVEPKAAETANHLRAKGQEALDALSAARRLLASDPSTIDRVAWAKVHNDLQNAGVQLAGTLGEKTSPRAIEETLKLVGDDYDSYTKRFLNKGENGVGVATIDSQIDTLKRNLDTEVKTTTGVKTSAQFFDTSKPPPSPPKPEDKLSHILSTNYAKVDPDSLDADDRAFQQITKGTDINATITAGFTNEHFSPVVNRALQTGIAPAQQRALDALQAAIRGADPAARIAALNVLGGLTGANKDQEGKQASATGANPAVRAAAKAIIEEASSDALTSAPGATPTEDLGPEVR